MLTFMSVALLIYGSMHLYALGKVWMAFTHTVCWIFSWVTLRLNAPGVSTGSGRSDAHAGKERASARMDNCACKPAMSK